MSTFRLGFVEGFYGRPWSWAERHDTAAFMAEMGFCFYLYAPKGDAFLRRRWREPWPTETRAELGRLARRFHSLGLSFGVGLSPYELGENFSLDKVDEIIGVGVDHLAILFDDMRGDDPGLARRQIQFAHAVKERWPQGKLSLVPTYYSLDPVLDRLFGQRPADYLETLGRELDASIEVFWTGERICSPDYSLEHLREIGAILKRKPLLWDNYPVNDTETMSRHLHLKPCTGRPRALRDTLSGHLLNPMLQPVLSRVPALTLYAEDPSFKTAASRVLGERLAARLEKDIPAFQERGLGKLATAEVEELLRVYAAFEHPGAREICAWLRGETLVTRELVLEQQ